MEEIEQSSVEDLGLLSSPEIVHSWGSQPQQQ